jgi:ABC-type amino acid transport substrate-binding protein
MGSPVYFPGLPHRKEGFAMMTSPFLVTALLFMVLGAAHAPVAAEPLPKELVVGTKIAPPFSMKNDDGTWSGISIELWRRIADELDLSYELREFDLQGLLVAVESGAVDAAVAALTVTPEREERMDFSHPFHTTGLAIAAPSGQKRGWEAAIGGILSLEFVQAIGALALLLLGVGFLMWLCERRRNPAQFGGGTARGIGSGFWWSAVTMTTVGYGDKAPVSFWGRMLGLVWMFAGIIVISGFTAAITSSLTLTRLESKVGGPDDLGRVRVVSVPGSTSAAYLERNRVRYRPVESPLQGVQEIAAGNADAAVYDARILKYLVNNQFNGVLEVLPAIFDRQDYGIAYPGGSPLREPINRVLLEHIRGPAWRDLLHGYLGR